MLIGHGFDIHRLVEGKKLVIGGVTIPYDLGADAHSDGDVIYHSVVDAILGEKAACVMILYLICVRVCVEEQRVVEARRLFLTLWWP